MTIEEIKRPERLDEDRIAALKTLFPEAFTDGRFNVQTLRELLEEPADTVGNVEHYSLNWPGKSQARKLAARSPESTLAPLSGKGVHEETSKNLVIVGDNLDVLRSIRRAYSSRIKMIYIDPPYNTGSDLIYHDDFKESLDTFLEDTGQRDSAGNLVTNPRSSGRYHSKWLNMIYPRLRIGRDLLKDDGVVFISIDDNELANLLLVCDEIFGEENFLALLARRSKVGGGSAAHQFAIEHDYVVVYCKDRNFAPKLFVPHSEEYAKRYSEQDKDGKYFWDTMERSYTQTRPYKIEAPDGTMLEGKWFRSEDRFLDDRELGEVRFIKKSDGGWSVQFKQRMPEGKKIRSLLSENEFKSSQDDLVSLGLGDTFSFPKPTHLLKLLIQAAVKDGEAVIDFFAGSGTTAHAMLELCSEDGIDRQFILVQVPEAIDAKEEANKKGFKAISDLTIERAKRAAEKYSTKDKNFGFKVYEQSNSSIVRFLPQSVSRLAELGKLNFGISNSLIEDWKPNNVITELMLLEGFPLDSHIEQSPDFDDMVHVVSHPERSYRLLICLSTDTLLDETVEAASRYPKDTFVCLESSLNDQLKLRLADAVENVKTL